MSENVLQMKINTSSSTSSCCYNILFHNQTEKVEKYGNNFVVMEKIKMENIMKMKKRKIKQKTFPLKKKKKKRIKYKCRSKGSDTKELIYIHY